MKNLLVLSLSLLLVSVSSVATLEHKPPLADCTWTAMTSVPSSYLFSIWGTPSSNVYAVGIAETGGIILHYNGSGWSKVIHIPGHTPGSVAACTDIDSKRILFGQDIHGPYMPQWGADPKQAAASLKKLIALKADILCEGHFGICQPAIEVKRYIQYYLDSL